MFAAKMEVLMNQFLNKLERKFGRYAIPNFMKYVIGLYILGYVVYAIDMNTGLNIYGNYLMLDIERVLHGQVWRLVTFLIQPISSLNPIFMLITLYLYYMIGTNLERAWGAFRFNLYFISGIIFNIIAAFIVYFISGTSFWNNFISLDYVNQSMFFAFAAMYPNVQLLVMYIIPVKVKYLGIAYGVFEVYQIISYLMVPPQGYYFVIFMLFAFANFIIFFLSSRNYRRISPSEIRRKQNYKRQMRQASYGNVTQFKGKNVVTRHKCAVCGRTELDDDNLEFRFCSKCEGNYEYCMDHLFTHEHVKH